MLRSIFTLVQRILDTDNKICNSTKSTAIIYCLTNPDNTVNMDIEIDGKRTKSLRNVEQCKNKLTMENRSNSFAIASELGDTITCRHKTDINIIPKKERKDEQRTSFLNNVDNVEKCMEIHESIDEAKTNVHDLMKNLPNQRIELNASGKDRITYLLEQVQKMKTGLKRLQDIVGQLNYAEKFGNDVNYLVNNVRKSLENSKDESSSANRNNLTRKN